VVFCNDTLPQPSFLGPSTFDSPDRFPGLFGSFVRHLRFVRHHHLHLVTALPAPLTGVLAEPGRRVTAEVKSGDPADMLLETVREREADLIVVGARGLSARDRYLMGSVAGNVLRHAPCSVLVVK
jgi:nucleotide-binding universal stress UspA family protein